MKKANVMRPLLALLLYMLILSRAPIGFGSEFDDTLTSDEALPINVGVELKPPPDEALIIPKNDPPAPMPYAFLLLAAIASAAICVSFIFARKVKAKRILSVATMVAAVLLTPCLSGAIYAANDFGNPLDASNIMLFAYYKDPNGWVLADTVPAFENYTAYGNYYDGFVRVWMDQPASNNFIGSQFYVDVCVRVRADGWILAWLTKDQSYAYIVFWGRTYISAGPPVIGATIPSRAIQRVFYASGKTFPGHSAINHYDFTHKTAKKLLIFGKSLYKVSGTSSVDFYYTFPSHVQIIDASTSTCFQGAANAYGKIYVDGTLIYNFPGGATPWKAINWPSWALTKEVKHTVRLEVFAPTGYGSTLNLAIILWLG